jgi:hypothetical protein
MKDEKCPSNDVRAGITHLRALREELCAQQSERVAGFAVRDFVVCELQTIHEQLLEETGPDWCIEKVEHILKSLIAMPADEDKNA